MQMLSKFASLFKPENGANSNTITLKPGSVALILGRDPQIEFRKFEGQDDLSALDGLEMGHDFVRSLLLLGFTAMIERSYANLTFGDAIYYGGIEAGVPREVMEMTVTQMTAGGWTVANGDHGGAYDAAKPLHYHPADNTK